MTARAGTSPCPWCAVPSRARHYDWCPCSTASRREIRAAYKISDEEGMRVADKIRRFAQREANIEPSDGRDLQGGTLA